MAGKTRGKKSVEGGKGYTYDLDAEKRLSGLAKEKAFVQKMMRFNEKRRKMPETNNLQDLQHSDDLYLEMLKEIDERIALLNAQALILECDDKPVDVRQLEKHALEEELTRAYCAKCASPNLKITKIIQIECRKCGRKRLITARLDESKR